MSQTQQTLPRAPAAGQQVGTMRAIRVHRYGGPEVLRCEDAPIPQPASGQVLVRVNAASVNPFDHKLASGAFQQFVPLTLPYIPGGDFSGVVETLGAGVAGVKRGDAVYGNTQPVGAYAQFVAAPADTIAAKPRKLSHVEAASAPVAGQTAWQALFDLAHLEGGQMVLIHGAAGGVGTFAVQLARWKGAKVLATASARNIEYLRSLGADQVIDYSTTPFETVVRDVDVVLDLVGGDTQARSFGVLRRGGWLIASSQPPSQEQANRQNVRAAMVQMQPSTPGLTRLAELLDAGAIKTVVNKTFPLSQAADAWLHTMSGHARGKVVLEIPS